MKTDTIYFGKFKGMKVCDLIENEPRYMLWLYTCDWVKDELKNEIESHFDKLMINFGKYEGKTLQHIKENDKQYYGWLTKPWVASE